MVEDIKVFTDRESYTVHICIYHSTRTGYSIVTGYIIGTGYSILTHVVTSATPMPLMETQPSKLALDEIDKFFLRFFSIKDPLGVCVPTF